MRKIPVSICNVLRGAQTYQLNTKTISGCNRTYQLSANVHHSEGRLNYKVAEGARGISVSSELV